MPRRPRAASGGYVYHVLNRAVGRATLFDKPTDYLAFAKVLRQAQDWLPVRLLAYCVLPNHWHLVLWPAHDGDLSEHLRWLTVTHTQRWHAHRHTAGTGPLYQGRFKSFPVQEDDHLLTVCRYVERNALRAGLLARAAGRCSTRGRCRCPRGGSSTSTRRKRRRSWRPCGGVWWAAARSGTRPGRCARPTRWGSRRRCGAAAGGASRLRRRPKTTPDPFSFPASGGLGRVAGEER